MTENNFCVDMEKIAVIIPAFNEVESIADVVTGILAVRRKSGFDIDLIVVNDCSTDATRQIVAKLDCFLLDLPINLGIGGAVQCGMRYAFNHGYDVAVQVDADGQHPPVELPKLLNELKKGEADVVVGSRFLGKEGYQSTLTRRLGIRYFQSLLALIIGLKSTDSTSGFRALNRRALEIACEYYPDEYPEVEALVLFSCFDLRIKEIPVHMRERQGGKSSIGPFSSIYYLSKVSIALIFTYFRFRKGRNYES